jgi:transposase
MNHQPVSTSFTRFVAVDLHKYYAVVGAVNRQQEVILAPRRVELDDLPAWAEKHLCQSDALVLEATTNAWTAYDLLVPLVGRCVVANPLLVKWIASARVKTDRQDVLRLAKLLAADLVPQVWVPPQHVRELRALISHRRGLIKMQTRVKNHLHSLLHRYHLKAPSGRAFAEKNRDWWEGLELSSTERLRVRQDLRSLDHLAEQLREVEGELRRLSTADSWKDYVPYLVQLPGFGLLTAMTVLAAIGDVTRFPTAKHLVGYAGLGAGVHDSGETHRGKGITKQGRRDLRRALVEAAWTAVNSHPYWNQEFNKLSRRKARNVAIVAIARKLLVAVWRVLSERAADKNAIPNMVAFKLMIWSWKLNDQQRAGLTSRQFVRYHLMRLKLGEDLPYLITGKGTKRAIASVEEVLAIRPELAAVD